MDSKFNDFKSSSSVDDGSPELDEPTDSILGLQDLETKPIKLGRDPEYRKRWISLGIIYGVNFLLGIQISLYWASLWPYLSQIDATASESFFGFVIMIFNLASAIGSPIFGFWSNRIHQTRIPIIAGIVITIIGNCIMAFVEDFSSNRRWVIFMARGITGLGLGNQGAVYAYVAMASTVEERNKATALRTAVTAIGVMLGPAVQTLFVPIGFPGFVWGNFIFNMYTAPAYLNMVIGVLLIIIMLIFFRDFWVSVDEAEMKQIDAQQEPSSSKIKPFDTIAVLATLYVQLVITFCLSYEITIGSPFTMAMFKWTPTEAVTYNGLITVSMGVFESFFGLFVGTVVLKYVRERVLVIVGLSSFILFYVISFPWPGLPPMVPTSPHQVFSNITNEVPSTSTSVSASPATTPESYSCDYVWCPYTTRVTLTQYIFAYFCTSLALAVALTPNGTLFSKILGPRKQGTMQGVFVASGQIAMTISPVICSNLFELYGPRAAWATGAAVLATAIILLVIVFKRLVPWDGETTEEATLLLSEEADNKSNYSATNASLPETSYLGYVY